MYFAENVDFTLDRSNIELGQDHVIVTVTLLNDGIANEGVEELQLTLVEMDAEDNEGEFLLDKVTITIVDRSGRQLHV